MPSYESIRGAKDFLLEVARGLYDNISYINKFGRSPNVDSGVDTDIWNRANATDNQVIWIAPTAPRRHNIVSTSTNDINGGTGARTLRVFGLKDWNSSPVTEVVTMNGTTDVSTVNDYVILYKMEVLTKGSTSSNVGTITATAEGDDTITAQIQPDVGQNQMAIFGIPSIQNCYVFSYYASFLKSGGATGSVDISIKVNPEPDVEPINFITKHTHGLISTGTTHFQHQLHPYLKIPGPAVIKIQGNGSVANLDVSAGFNAIIVNEA
jgi:hypothetical protein